MPVTVPRSTPHADHPDRSASRGLTVLAVVLLVLAGLGATSAVAQEVDDEPPVLVVPQSVVVVNATGPDGDVATWGFSATDDVGVVDRGCDPASGSTFLPGFTDVTCWARDAAGNEATDTFQVWVRDVGRPSIEIVDVQVAREENSNWGIVTWDVVVSDDISAPEDIEVVCVPDSGARMYIEPNIPLFTCVAVDEAGNESRLASYSIDGVAPDLVLPDNLVVGTDPGLATAVVDFAVTATDGVDGAVPATCAPTSGSTFDLGDTEVSCTATDAAGNTAEGSFTVTVVDDEAPSVSTPSDIVVGTDDGLPTAVVTFAATAGDNVGVAGLACDPGSGSAFGVGDTEVTCTATDAAGNLGSGSFTVTVRDDEAPTLVVPDEVVVTATSVDGAMAEWTIEASDNVGVATRSCSPPSGAAFPLGTTSVACTAIDAAGNVAADTFPVTVEVAPGPVAIEILVADVEASGFRRGIERRLVGPLEQAAKLLADGNPDNDDAVCDKLAESAGALADIRDDGEVTTVEAERLATYTTALREGLGCHLDA